MSLCPALAWCVLMVRIPALSHPPHAPHASYGCCRSGHDWQALDWLMLSYASEVHRIGAQHSSYVTSAKLAGCRVREVRARKDWRFKSAASWLYGKVRSHAKQCHTVAPPQAAAGQGMIASQAALTSRSSEHSSEPVASAASLTAGAHGAEEGDGSDLCCNTSIAKLMSESPCATPCLVPCRIAIQQAYA